MHELAICYYYLTIVVVSLPIKKQINGFKKNSIYRSILYNSNVQNLYQGNIIGY